MVFLEGLALMVVVMKTARKFEMLQIFSLGRKSNYLHAMNQPNLASLLIVSRSIFVSRYSI